MPTKAERTTQFIIETVAPLFNQNGYVGTSMSDITKATGLTKGAIYGNFDSKEALALKAFKYNLKKLLSKLEEQISVTNSPIQKLFVITNFYRHYNDYTKGMGGCPILNIGIDANNRSEELMNNVRSAILRIQNNLRDIIDDGKKQGEIKITTDSNLYARRILSMIEGATFSATTMNDDKYLKDMMNMLDNMIINELKN